MPRIGQRRVWCDPRDGTRYATVWNGGEWEDEVRYRARGGDEPGPRMGAVRGALSRATPEVQPRHEPCAWCLHCWASAIRLFFFGSTWP